MATTTAKTTTSDSGKKFNANVGTERRYQQEPVCLRGKYILVEKVKVTEKQEKSEFTATQQTEPYAVAFGKKTYEIQLTGVDPELKGYFNEILMEQEQYRGLSDALPNLQTYDYHPRSGKLRLDYNLIGVIIEEVTKENAEPFDVKMSALKRKYEDRYALDKELAKKT